MEVFLELHSRQRERGQLVSEDYARGIQTFKCRFAQYGHQELAGSLPELPQGNVTRATGKVNATASDSSHSPRPERSLHDRAVNQTENHHEDLSPTCHPKSL